MNKFSKFGLVVIGLAASAALSSTAMARRGADDAPGHVRQCRGCDDPAGHIRHGHGADDPIGHVRGGHGADDAAGHVRHGGDDLNADDRGRGRGRGRGGDDVAGHGRDD